MTTNASTTTTSTSTISDEQCRYVSRLYDTTLLHSRSGVLELVVLLVYAPLGIVLLAVRLLLVGVLKLALAACPPLRCNAAFVRLASLLVFGVYTSPVGRKPLANTNGNATVTSVFVSNHVTSLDYLAVKSVIASVEHWAPSRTNNNSNSDMCDRIVAYLTNAFHTHLGNSAASKHRDEDLLQSTSSPLLVFPEMEATNGAYALHKFDEASVVCTLHSLLSTSSISVRPVCLRVHRPLCALSVNMRLLFASRSRARLAATLAGLFWPVSVYELDVLDEMKPLLGGSGGSDDVDAETPVPEALLERVRRAIAARLRLDCSSLSRGDVERICGEYHALVARRRQRQHEQRRLQLQQQQQQQQQQQRTSANLVEFNDISTLALRIKDILPHVSYQTINRHIQLASTLDIDSVMASILDADDAAEASQPARPSPPLLSQSSPVRSSSSSSSTSSSSPPATQQTASKSRASASKMKSYEERKFELLNEARQRYLAKHPLGVQAHRT